MSCSFQQQDLNQPAVASSQVLPEHSVAPSVRSARSSSPPIPTIQRGSPPVPAARRPSPPVPAARRPSPPVRKASPPVPSAERLSPPVSAAQRRSSPVRRASPPVPSARRASPAVLPAQRASPPIPTVKVQIEMATPQRRSARKSARSSASYVRLKGDHHKPPELPVETNWDQDTSPEESLPDSRPTSSQGPQRSNVLSQLTAMRRQLQLEQERLERQMTKDDRYEVYDSRLDDRPRMSAARGRDVNVFDGLDPEEIARRNRERKQQLDQWKNGGGGDDFGRQSTSLNRGGSRMTGENDDDVLNKFLSNNPSRR